MQIELYDDIKKGLEEHLENIETDKQYIPNSVLGFEPSKPVYPFVVFSEVYNTPYQNLNSARQTVASLSYKLDVYAKSTTSKYDKQKIARNIVKNCNDYLVCIGLNQDNYNEFQNEGNNGEIYHIVVMYSVRYFENKEYFI